VELEPVTIVESPLCWRRIDDKLVFYQRTPTLEQTVGDPRAWRRRAD
jgi:hypothetical protein